MVALYTYKCSQCDFTIPMFLDRTLYIIDGNGERRFCPHPSEAHYVSEVLGITRDQVIKSLAYQDFVYGGRVYVDDGSGSDAVEEMIRGKLGYATLYVCLDCSKLSSFDIDKDQIACKDCKSVKMKKLSEMHQESCPKCKNGIIIRNYVGVA